MSKYDYDIDALEDGIKKCKVNIETFEEAIEGEWDTIKQYRNIIKTLREKEKLQEGIVIDADTLH